MFESIRRFFETYSPLHKLTLQLHEPVDQTVVCRRKGGNRFLISSHPYQVFVLQELTFQPPLVAEKAVSDGAVVGAGAYAMLGRDPLKGAIIGQKLSQQKGSKHHQTRIALCNEATKEEVVLAIGLNTADAQTVQQFFEY